MVPRRESGQPGDGFDDLRSRLGQQNRPLDYTG